MSFYSARCLSQVQFELEGLGSIHEVDWLLIFDHCVVLFIITEFSEQRDFASPQPESLNSEAIQRAHIIMYMNDLQTLH